MRKDLKQTHSIVATILGVHSGFAPSINGAQRTSNTNRAPRISRATYRKYPLAESPCLTSKVTMKTSHHQPYRYDLCIISLVRRHLTLLHLLLYCDVYNQTQNTTEDGTVRHCSGEPVEYPLVSYPYSGYSVPRRRRAVAAPSFGWKLRMTWKRLVSLSYTCDSSTVAPSRPWSSFLLPRDLLTLLHR